MKPTHDITKSLIDITTELDDLEAWISDNPEDTASKERYDFLTKSLDEEFSNLENKIDAFGHVKETLELEEELNKKLSEKYLKVARRRRKAVERLEGRILNVMQTLNLTKVKGQSFEAKLRAPSVSLEVDELSLEMMESLPSQFKRIKYELDKNYIKDRIKNNGEIFQWARLKEKVGLIFGPK